MRTSDSWMVWKPVPAGIKWPRITFSLRPTRWSVSPARAASVSTLVVSWKLAAEMKLLLCTDALVMPKQLGAGRGRLGLGALGQIAAERLDLGVGLLEHVLGHDRAFGEVAVALVR